MSRIFQQHRSYMVKVFLTSDVSCIFVCSWPHVLKDFSPILFANDSYVASSYQFEVHIGNIRLTWQLDMVFIGKLRNYGDGNNTTSEGNWNRYHIRLPLHKICLDSLSLCLQMTSIYRVACLFWLATVNTYVLGGTRWYIYRVGHFSVDQSYLDMFYFDLFLDNRSCYTDIS